MVFLRRLFRPRIEPVYPRVALCPCAECGKPICNGDLWYIVQTDMKGFTDDTTRVLLVCDSCYQRRYGYEYLRTWGQYQYTAEQLEEYFKEVG